MESLDLKGKKVALAGFAMEGKSAHNYFAQRGATISVYDERGDSKESEIPEDVEYVTGPGVFQQLNGFDIVSRTAAVAPWKIETDGEVTSTTNEFLKHCPAPIIGVTGTKGKGTTCSLITALLKKAGKTTHLVGNIGVPVLDQLNSISADDIVVFEISSFQLWDAKISPHMAVVLMIEPEHLDFHKDFDDYLKAKSNITAHQTADDTAIYHPTNEHSLKVAQNGNGVLKRYMSDDGANIIDGKLVINAQEIMPTSEFGLLGPHNHENICAAVTAAWQYAQDISAIRDVIKEFTGLEHRLELAGEARGVKYYDDSFGTTPATAIAALNSFEQPTVIILGGSDKGSDYTSLAEAIIQKPPKKVLLIGKMGPTIQAVLDKAEFTDYEFVDGGMVEIVEKASAIAEPGDVVLLSPAAASFDMFKNYKDRGTQFKQCVSSL